ncbi:hypothetical protein EG328_010680 [Venturia inaequalis]|uniref:Uncharacterized protein n=1 Tax=Venturia inaequalis TaxID=5025 RepID=A0A8H3UMS0_VENIN|nr:hypothetical protein EG327_009652 [Venturia inaequalis]KAE9982687.1 hypothetical protein EG328_010680 [Venturia inaequalis]RDI84357.1 hypothetical protein Vi05172_g5635 [Venturia inaequalis]
MTPLPFLQFIKTSSQSESTKDQTHASNPPRRAARQHEKVRLTEAIQVSNPQKRYHLGSTYHTSSDLTISTTHYIRAAFGFSGSRKKRRGEIEPQENSAIDEEARAASLERIRDDLIRVMLDPPKKLEQMEGENWQQTKKKPKKRRVHRICSGWAL